MGIRYTGDNSHVCVFSCPHVSKWSHILFKKSGKTKPVSWTSFQIIFSSQSQYISKSYLMDFQSIYWLYLALSISNAPSFSEPQVAPHLKCCSILFHLLSFFEYNYSLQLEQLQDCIISLLPTCHGFSVT